MAAAFGAFSMFSYQAFKESSVNYDIGNPSVRTFGLRVIPARFTVETRNLFVIKVTQDDYECGRISGRIDELGYKQEFTRSELFHGVRSEINPRQPGIFQMRFYCDERAVASVPVTVTLPKTALPSRVVWELDAGDVTYQTSSFEIPVFVRALEIRGNRKAPFAVSNDTKFLVEDDKGNVKPFELTIPKNTALSAPVPLPFPINADYQLLAFNQNSRQRSQPLNLVWKQRGPQLHLAVSPNTINIYSVPISARVATVYIEGKGKLVSPTVPLSVIVQPPINLLFDPNSQLPLSPQAPSGQVHIHGAGTSGMFTAVFEEPTLGLSSQMNIHVLSIGKFLIWAALAGLLGVLMGRGFDLFTEKGWRLFITLGTAAVAGLALYFAIVSQYIPPHPDESALAFMQASFIGMIGGYMGLGVFKILAKVFGAP